MCMATGLVQVLFRSQLNSYARPEAAFLNKTFYDSYFYVLDANKQQTKLEVNTHLLKQLKNQTKKWEL